MLQQLSNYVGELWEVLVNIFWVKNDGNDIRGGRGSVGRRGGDGGEAIDGIGRTTNGLRGDVSCRGSIDSLDIRSDDV
jgi:hypothetical protein